MTHAPRQITVVLLLTLALATACSSPLGDDDPDATPTTPDATSAATATTLPATAATATPEPADPEPSATSGSPTATPAQSTATRPAATSAATATDEPLPADGAELLIEGGPATAVVNGDESGTTLYATSAGQLWRSDDSGRTWTEISKGEFGPLITAINNENVLFSGDRGGCGRGFSFLPFQRSLDGGETWSTLSDSMDIAPYLAFAIQDTTIVYGSNCGLSVSTDSGTTWVPVPDLNGEEIFAVATERTAPMEQLIVAAATEGGTGRLFLLDTADPANPLFVDTLAQYWGDAAIDWSAGRIVIAHAHQVGVSDDGGATWQWSRDGLEDATYSVDPFLEAIPEDEIDPARRFKYVRIDPDDRDRIWIGGTRGAFLSVDGGATWERIGDDVDITGIAVASESNRVIISSANGARLWDRDRD